MIIAIEGMDGSGKTSISKIVANKIGYKYLDKPIEQFLNITEYEYHSPTALDNESLIDLDIT